MRVKGVSHIPIGIRDTERSLVFWRDFMGLEVTFDTDQALAERRTVFLRWDPDKSSPFISLGSRPTRSPAEAPVGPGQLGINHIAFWVEDLDAYVAAARALSIKVVSEPVSFNDRAVPYGDLDRDARVRSATFQDPDGVYVQLEEWLR